MTGRIVYVGCMDEQNNRGHIVQFRQSTGTKVTGELAPELRIDEDRPSVLMDDFTQTDQELVTKSSDYTAVLK